MFEDRVTPLFEPDELTTSGELARRLIAAGQSPTAARQQLARAARRQLLWRSSSLQLPHRERLCASKQAVGTIPFLRQLEEQLREKRPGISRVLTALRHHQVLLAPEAKKLLANRGEAEYDRDRRALKEVGVICWNEGTSLERFALSIVENSGALAQHRYQQLLSDVQIARAVMEMLARQAFVSWDGANYSDGPSLPAAFTGYPFSAYGWSWLAPLLSWSNKKPQPAPLLLDVYSGECNLFDVEGFRSRLARVNAISRKGSPLVGAIAARRFDKAAFAAARNAGLMVINLRTVFGESALRLMSQVATLLDQLAFGTADESILERSVDGLSNSLEELHVHPFVTELRSLGFETLSALLTRGNGWEDVRVGISVPFQKTSRDIDVSGMRDGGRSAILIECKAHRSDKPLSVAALRKFFHETVPAFMSKRQDEGWPIEHCNAEMWTTSEMTAEARSALSEIKLNHRVVPAIRDVAEIERSIPQSMEPCRRLLRTISAS
ncbi:MAG: hypothetical protein AB7L71_01620 [Vicinamibacterales bacterium]